MKPYTCGIPEIPYRTPTPQAYSLDELRRLTTLTPATVRPGEYVVSTSHCAEGDYRSACLKTDTDMFVWATGHCCLSAERAWTGPAVRVLGFYDLRRKDPSQADMLAELVTRGRWALEYEIRGNWC